MDNNEMSRIIAEKVHEWPVIDAEHGPYPRPDTRINNYGPYLLLITPDNPSVVYDPATNVAQAIEAAEALCKNQPDDMWEIASPKSWLEAVVGEGRFVAWIHVGGLAFAGDGRTPALAICEALIEAVSDDG